VVIVTWAMGRAIILPFPFIWRIPVGPHCPSFLPRSRSYMERPGWRCARLRSEPVRPHGGREMAARPSSTATVASRACGEATPGAAATNPAANIWLRQRKHTSVIYFRKKHFDRTSRKAVCIINYAYFSPPKNAQPKRSGGGACAPPWQSAPARPRPAGTVTDGTARAPGRGPRRHIPHGPLLHL
jgi:hypothetical protein